MTRASNVPSMAMSEVVDRAPVAIFRKDAAGRYTYINKQFEVETGISSRDAIGLTVFDVFPPDLAAVYHRHSLRTQEEMSPLRFDQPARLMGRERLYSTLEFPIIDGEEVAGVCGISIDITDEAKGATIEQESRADVFFGRLLGTLTPQEVRVLDLVAAGLSDREIAEQLSLSGGTVRHHVSHLLKKLRKRRAQVIIEMLKRDRL